MIGGFLHPFEGRATGLGPADADGHGGTNGSAKGTSRHRIGSDASNGRITRHQMLVLLLVLLVLLLVLLVSDLVLLLLVPDLVLLLLLVTDLVRVHVVHHELLRRRSGTAQSIAPGQSGIG